MVTLKKSKIVDVSFGLGAAIRRVRVKRTPLKLEAAAKRAGIDHSTLSKIERGADFTQKTLGRIAASLGVTPLTFYVELLEESAETKQSSLSADQAKLLDVYARLAPLDRKRALLDLEYKAAIAGLDEADQPADPPSFSGLTGQKKSAGGSA